jgi:sporulation protein YlmC with PRC-barrel domain
MRLELGTHVDCVDGPLGSLRDVVIDPTRKRVTQLVVEPDREDGVARLVPIELAQPGGESTRAIGLRLTLEEAGQLPPVHGVAYLNVGDAPVDDPDWDVGIQEVLALPYYTAYELEPIPLDFLALYDRVPKNEVELRRASSVRSADGHERGEVDGFVVDGDDQITHFVLERGHLWGRREVAIPIGAVSAVETDEVTVGLTRDEVGALPGVRVHRLPPPPSRPRRPA